VYEYLPLIDYFEDTLFESFIFASPIIKLHKGSCQGIEVSFVPVKGSRAVIPKISFFVHD
jgi:hypothetical protein